MSTLDTFILHQFYHLINPSAWSEMNSFQSSHTGNSKLIACKLDALHLSRNYQDDEMRALRIFWRCQQI
jgi:hypothetical protein